MMPTKAHSALYQTIHHLSYKLTTLINSHKQLKMYYWRYFEFTLITNTVGVIEDDISLAVKGQKHYVSLLMALQVV